MPLVRSEGGEDVSNFNNLPRWATGKVHFTPMSAFPAPRQSGPLFWHLDKIRRARHEV